MEHPKFSLTIAIVGALAGGCLGYLLAWHPLEIVGAAGLGFVSGGALPIFKGILPYLAVFFAAAGGFVWWMVHYVLKVN